MPTALETILMTAYKEQMIAFAMEHPKCIDEMIELAISDKDKLCWRAAWLLHDCIEENDVRVKKHVRRFIDVIEHKKDGHQREILKVLLKIDLDEESEGYLFNLCMNMWEKIGSSPSIRFTALLFIIKTAKKYPELNGEILLLGQDHYIESLSHGIQNAARRLFDELK